jgi:hypothetical protein
MSLLDGKQLRDGSLSLNKISGINGYVTFSSATMVFDSGSSLKQVDSNINTGIDVVNKNYVDAVAQGLNIKESVHVISLEPITTYGTQSIDSHIVQVGERVLVNGQDNSIPTASNGIYVVDSMTWSRSEDADGLPSLGEVQIGDFVFVAYGDTWKGTGWVLNQSDSSDFNILVGTESQHWVQFSSAGVISAGDGLIQTGADFNVNTGTGLTISSNQVVIDITGVTAGSYGSATEIPTFTVNAQGQLTSAGTVSISIPPQFEFGTGLTANGLTVSVNFESITGTGLTQNGSQISVDTDVLAITLSGFGLTQNGGTISVSVENGLSIDSISNSIVLGGTLSQNTTINGSQSYSFIIDEINDFKLNFTGSATVSVGLSEQGLVYSATPSSATPLTLIHKQYVDDQIGDLADVDNISIILNESNQISISATISGQGLTYSSSTGIMDINWGGTSSGLTFSVDNSLKVNVDGTSIFINNDGELQGLELQSGQGLTYSNNVMDINWGGTSSGLTFSVDNSLKVNVDGSTIIVNDDGELQAVSGSAQPVYDQFISLNTTGDNHQTGATLSYIPNNYSRIQVYVNGQLQRLGDGVTSSVDCYFDSSGKSLNTLTIGDELYWNGLVSGFDLSIDDKIDIIYES